MAPATDEVDAMKWMDRVTERFSRNVAQRTSRRGVLGGLGVMMLGAAAFPLLPVARGAEAPAAKPPAAKPPKVPGPRGSASAGGNPSQPVDPGDAASCEYWRHCAIDELPVRLLQLARPRAVRPARMSAVTWIGTCHNPGDGRDFVISYNDCCGRSGCGRCFCNRNQGDTPLYQPGRANDYNWCTGRQHRQHSYHCSTARIVGVAE
ncbi:MAG: methylamine dehydrogenase light chain [Steroidobacteraceae bacterium]